MKIEIVFKDETLTKHTIEEPFLFTDVQNGFYIIGFQDPKNEYRTYKRSLFNMEEIFSILELPYEQKTE